MTSKQVPKRDNDHDGLGLTLSQMMYIKMGVGESKKRSSWWCGEWFVSRKILESSIIQTLKILYGRLLVTRINVD
ncbi:unnamed protein product, partial [Larinioides sclopetarius]